MSTRKTRTTPELETWADEVDPVAETDDLSAPPSPLVESRYEPTGELLGQGGLGRVEAVRDRDLGREVARKQSLSDAGAHRERFLREARVTAQLEHPGIVPVYELGQDASGKLFYTMRRIRGRTLGAALKDCRRLEDRLGLLPAFVAAAQAVAFAHARGVVHRDLKPDNIMVGEFGETLVVDWGLAKVRDETEVDIAPSGFYPAARQSGANLTRMGSAIGTPAYMSPEQARGEAVDARADVWGLGAILFELLAGHPPFDGLEGDTAVERLRRNDLDDVRPQLKGVPRELVAIVLKALEAEPDRRYADASAVAADVVRWQAGGLVDAYRYSPREVLTKALRRFRTPIVAGFVGFFAFAFAGAWSYRQILVERDRALEAEQIAERSAAETRLRLARSMALASAHALSQGDNVTAYVMALGSLELAESPEARGSLIASASAPQPTLLTSDRFPTPCALPVLSPTGAAACWTQGGVRVWEHFPGESKVYPIPRVETRDAWSLDISPSGRRVVASHYDGTGWTWERGQAEFRLMPWKSTVAVRFWDEDRLALANEEGAIGLADFAGQEPRWSTKKAVVRFESLTRADDGSMLVGGVVDPVHRWLPEEDRWEIAAGGLVAPIVAGSADGRWLAASGGWGGSVRPIRVLGPGVDESLPVSGGITTIAISADGQRVLAAGYREISVWDGPTWALTARIPSDSLILGMSVDRDATAALVAENDGDLRHWSLPPRAPRRPLDQGGTVWDVRATADATLLGSSGNDGIFRAWDLPGLTIHGEYPVDPTGTGFFELIGHDAVLTTNQTGLIRLSLDDGAVRWRLPFEGVCNDLQRAPWGDLLVALSSGEIAMISPEGALKWRRRVPARWAISAYGTHDGRVLVTADNQVVWLSRDTGDTLDARAAVDLTDTSVPIGDSFIATSFGKLVHYDKDGGIIREFTGGHPGKVRTVSVRGDLLASASDQGAVCLWALSGERRACWDAHTGTVWRLAFIGDEPRLATGGADGAVRIWDLGPLTAKVSDLLPAAQRRFGLQAGDDGVIEIHATGP